MFLFIESYRNASWKCALPTTIHHPYPTASSSWVEKKQSPLFQMQQMHFIYCQFDHICFIEWNISVVSNSYIIFFYSIKMFILEAITWALNLQQQYDSIPQPNRNDTPHTQPFTTSQYNTGITSSQVYKIA